MSSFTSRLAGSASLIMFPALFLWRKKRKYLFIIPLIILCGCYQHYFRTGTTSQVNDDLLQKMQAMNKHFIIHYPSGNYTLSNVSVNDNILTGDKSDIPEVHSLQLTPDTGRPNKVKKAIRDSVLMEVHLYTDKPQTTQTRISLPVADITRADIYEVDKRATKSNHVISTIGVVIGSAFVLSILALAIACNCPQVYVENNGNYQFNGGLYSGAVYAPLERTDYMPLGPLVIDNNIVKFKISNAPAEAQFINSVNLLQVDHAVGSSVLADRHGKVFSITEPEISDNITNNNSENLTKQLSEKDGITYGFNDRSEETFSNIILKFKKPERIQNGRLVIHGKNSGWSGYMFKNFNALFGEGMESWRKKQDKGDPVEMENWLKNQALPMMVSVKKQGKWIPVDYFSTPGNTANRDMIMNIDLSGLTGTIELKLETAYRFWELDYAAMDFSQKEFNTELVHAYKALNESKDVSKLLLDNDSRYSELTGTESLQLEFKVSTKNELKERSYFLVSRGYYHNLEKHAGKPNALLLMQFKKKGAFSNYSRSTYNDLNRELAKNTRR